MTHGNINSLNSIICKSTKNPSSEVFQICILIKANRSSLAPLSRQKQTSISSLGTQAQSCPHRCMVWREAQVKQPSQEALHSRCKLHSGVALLRRAGGTYGEQRRTVSWEQPASCKLTLQPVPGGKTGVTGSVTHCSSLCHGQDTCVTQWQESRPP